MINDGARGKCHQDCVVNQMRALNCVGERKRHGFETVDDSVGDKVGGEW